MTTPHVSFQAFHIRKHAGLYRTLASAKEKSEKIQIPHSLFNNSFFFLKGRFAFPFVAAVLLFVPLVAH